MGSLLTLGGDQLRVTKREPLSAAFKSKGADGVSKA